MKFVFAISALALVAIATVSPTQTDREEVLTFGQKILKQAETLLKDFPSVPASGPLKNETEKVNTTIQVIEGSTNLTHMVDTMRRLVLSEYKIDQIERHLRHPEKLPQDTQIQAATYGKNLLNFAEILLKQVTDVELAKEVKEVIVSVKRHLKRIESKYELTYAIDMGGLLGVDNYLLSQLSLKQIRIRFGNHTMQ